MSTIEPGSRVQVRSTGTGNMMDGIFMGPKPGGPEEITYSAVWFKDDNKLTPGVVDHGGCSPWVVEAAPEKK